MIGICPNCNKRYSYNKYDVDYIHNCVSDSEYVTKDDVLIVGTYIDEDTGLTVEKPRQSVALQGVSNKAQFTRAGIEGTNINSLTSKGNNAKLYRQRKHFEHIQIKKGGI